MNNFFRKKKRFIEYIFFYLLFCIINILPLIMVSNFGGFILKTFGPLSKSHKIALKNYKKVFLKSSNAKTKKIINQSWENLGRTFSELLILDKIIDNNNTNISLQGLKKMQSIIKNKQKCIFIGIHQSNWEILPSIVEKIGFNIVIVYRHINNNFIDTHILKKRMKCIKSKNSFFTPKGNKSAKDIIYGLNKKLSILILIDQKDSAGKNIKLFNYETKTQTGFVKIAKKHNLKIIPIQNIRKGPNKFKIVFHSPVKYNKKDSEEKIMLKIHKIIENWIIQNPNQWFWQHNRFN